MAACGVLQRGAVHLDFRGVLPMQASAVSLGNMARLGSRCQPKGPWARPQE